MTSFEEQHFTSDNFSKQSLEKHSFTHCLFTGCDFSETLLRKARFSSCTFSHCNFSLVKLEGCRLQEVLFVDCKVLGADFFPATKPFSPPISITVNFNTATFPT